MMRQKIQQEEKDMDNSQKTELFEQMPIPRAVAQLAIPTILSSLVMVIYNMFCERLKGKLEPAASGHGSIDLIMPGCHKALGLKRLAERWGISPDQCAAFGDGGNDIEMLNYCAHSYAMENAPQNVKNAAKHLCPSNEEDGVLVVLEKLFG